jgi:CheY-like chemotaxis protein
MDKVLIVDDNPVNVKVLSSTLAESGYDLLTANTGERALMVAERAKPDIILLDINMPGINGYDTCRKLKASDTTKDIPVIFLSALNEIENKIEGFEVGGVDYIAKPFNQKEVCIRVENHLKISKLSRELEHKNQELNEAFEELQVIQEQLLDINTMLVESIQYSQRIQEAIIPSEAALQIVFPQSFAYFQPKSIVSGDFYWVFESENYKFLAVGDCTGHGVPGAFMSLLGISALTKIVEDQKIVDPGLILNRIDHEIQRVLKQQSDSTSVIRDGMDIIVCCFDINNQVLHFASAQRPLLMYRSGQIEMFEAMRQSIGYDGYHMKTAFMTCHVPLKAGDTFYLYSDGITDQFGGESGRKFTPKRLRHFLGDCANQPLAIQKNNLIDLLRSWKGYYDQTDDMTLIGIKIQDKLIHSHID